MRLVLSFRETVRTVLDKHLEYRANEWKEHLNSAEATRDVYGAFQNSSKKVLRLPLSVRIPLFTFSYDYPKQLSIPMLSKQTMNEWFSEKK